MSSTAHCRERSSTVSSPLRIGQTSAVLEAEIVPAQLPEGQARFELRADATHRPNGHMSARSAASKAGAATEYVDVWLTVPWLGHDRARPAARWRAERPSR